MRLESAITQSLEALLQKVLIYFLYQTVDDGLNLDDPVVKM
jgi:hypothetical protein